MIATMINIVVIDNILLNLKLSRNFFKLTESLIEIVQNE